MAGEIEERLWKDGSIGVERSCVDQQNHVGLPRLGNTLAFRVAPFRSQLHHQRYMPPPTAVDALPAPATP